MSTQFLVIDVGTSGLRAAIVDEHLDIVDIEYRANPPSTPFEGLVEFDATHLADLVLEACHTIVARTTEPPSAIGITNQRASTVVWDRASGVPVGPGLGWQDLRTITECIVAKAEHGWSVAPNQSITKVASILASRPDLDVANLCFGTIDSWIAWTLTHGAVHVSDGTNMSTTTTGMRVADGSTWALDRLAYFGIDPVMLPTVVDSAAIVGNAIALPGAPPIASMVGDQQGSLIGQGCVHPGVAKLTLGTGGMLDLVTDAAPPTEIERDPAGTYALPTWQLDGQLTWGAEGIMLSAGTNVEWLRDDLQIIETSAASHEAAQACADSGGVMYVPALLGLGTPHWDYGARGTLLGLTRGSERSHIVRAVLEGVAHRAADLVDAARADTGVDITRIRVDGGMSQNPTMIQALADATGLEIDVAPSTDSTTRGAAFLAGLAIGTWTDVTDVAQLCRPAATIHPNAAIDRPATRTRWHDAVVRSGEWHPDLSALDF